MDAVTLDAGHRVDSPHDCFLMNCKALGRDVESLRGQLVAANLAHSDARALLERLEWIVGLCPACDGLEVTGHEPDCELAALL